MAFNPFEGFRKNQRTLMAIASIVCMIVFVFSFGQGDLFQTLQEWLATSARPTPKVATLYGKTVHEADLDKIARQRDLANSFMIRSAAMGVNMAMTELEKQQKDIKEGQENPFGRVMQGWGMRRNPFFAQQMRLPPGWQMMSVQNDLSFLSAQAQATKSAEQARTLDTLATSLGFEAWETNAAMRGQDEMYFGGGKSPEDLLDFMVWLKTADKLGIQLTENDVRRNVNREAANQEIWPENAALRSIPSVQGIARNGMINETELLKGLTDEFRVVMAKESVLGEAVGVRGFRDLREPMQRLGNAVSPNAADFFEFYKDQRSSLGVVMLPVQAKDFISQVKEEPTEAEMKAYFNDFKENEFNPESDKPGFRAPRKVKAQYATAKAESPIFRKKAQVNALAPFVMRTLGGLQGDAFGASLAGNLGNIITGFAQEPMFSEYRIFRESRTSWIDPPFSSAESLHEQSISRPDLAAALVGQVAGSALTLGSIFQNAATFPGGALAYEAKVRLKALPSAVLSAASMDPYSAIALPFSYVPTVPEMSTVVGSLFEKYLDISAPRLMRENLVLFTEELGKLKNKPEEANKLIAEAPAKFGVEVKSMKSAKPYFEINNDSDLADLKKSFLESYKDAPQAPEFWQLFFSGVGTFESLRWSPDDRNFQNDPSRWIFSREPYLIWRSEDMAAKDRTFDEAKSDIIFAWKLQRARKLARTEAEKISDEAKKKTWAPAYSDLVKEVQSFFGSQSGKPKVSDLKELNGVTRLVPQNTTGPGQAKTYLPFRVPTEVISFPRANLVEQIASLKKPGESLVVRDRPETTYYVTILVSRSAPSPAEFKKIYENASVRSKEPDTLWQLFLDQFGRDFRNDLIKKMRMEAAQKLDDNGRIPVADTYRNRSNRDESGS